LAKEYNKPTKDGQDMLIYQGVIAFEHFCDYRYSFEDILFYMQKTFELD
jgi:shikimate dehydrogenase